MTTLMRTGMAAGLSHKVVIMEVIRVSVSASPFQSAKCISNFTVAGECCSSGLKQKKQGVLMGIPITFSLVFILCRQMEV